MLYILISLVVLVHSAALYMCYVFMRDLWDREQDYSTGCFDNSRFLKWLFRNRGK